jgi:hypothetical protein
MAMNAPSNLAPGMGATDGTTGSTTSTGTMGSGSSTMTTSAGTTKQTTNGATAFKAPAALSLASLVVVAVALFL